MNATKMTKKEALRLSKMAEDAKDAILESSHDGEVIPADEAMSLIKGLEELIGYFSEKYAKAN